MSMKIRRIVADLATDNIDIQILALTTIPRLKVGIKATFEDFESLRQAIIQSSSTGNSDLTFLARKALNHLDGLQSAPVNDTPIVAVTQNSSTPPLAAPRLETISPQDDGADSERNVPGLDISGTGDPTVDDGDDEMAATVVRTVESSETFDIERQLVKEEDPRRIATLLATLATEATDVFVLNRVVAFLTHDNDRVRANAVEVFERLGNGREHMSFLTPMLKDENNRVRSNVIKALGKFGHPQTKLYLSEMLNSPEVSMRESAVYTLCELKSLK